MVRQATLTAVNASISTPVGPRHPDIGGHADPGGSGGRHQLHGDLADGQRMAQRDQLVRPLGGHDAGDAGDRQDIALLGLALLDQRERLGGHGDEALGAGGALRRGLVRDVDHARLALVVEM